MKYRTFIILLTIIFAIISSCNCNRDDSSEDNLESVLSEIEVEEQIENNLELVKEIIYSLPSPLETSMMIKRAGADFTPEVLSNDKKVEEYVTLDEMSLALGVYTTDLSYASLFDQSQHIINYMDACKKLAENLGILNVISDEVVKKLEDNINDRDVIIEVVSETLMNTNQTLQDENRTSLSVLSLIGGWIEGMYIATYLLDESTSEKTELMDRILEQKLAMENVYRIMLQYKNDAQMRKTFKELKDLKRSFDLIEVKTEKTETKHIGGKVILRSERKFHISESGFRKLKKKIAKVRNNFVK